MSDIVNDYFKQFYPAEFDQDKWRFDDMLGGMWKYCDYDVRSIFPKMVCVDGFTMSVQGHAGAYSSPRSDFAEKYNAVEIGYPSEREDLLMGHIDGDPDTTDPTDTVYGYVPVSTVIEVIKKHGGLRAREEKP